MDLIAFNGDQAIKEQYLARVREHRRLDEIAHGVYADFPNKRFCAVGCTIHSDDHRAYETELGIPRQLAHLEDGIFESLPNGESKEWPEAFLEAIPVGANLYPAYWRFMYWLLVDSEDGVLRFAKTDEQREAIQSVAGLYQRQIDGRTVKLTEWQAAAAAAATAADADADAAYAAANAAAYAADAAYAYAYAADAATAYAATAAAAAYAAAAYAATAAAAAAYAADAADAAGIKARIKARIKQSQMLLKFLKAA